MIALGTVEDIREEYKAAITAVKEEYQEDKQLMKMKKRFLSILLSLVMVLGLMIGMSATAYADGTPTYTIGVYDLAWSELRNLSTNASLPYTMSGEEILEFEDYFNSTVVSITLIIATATSIRSCIAERSRNLLKEMYSKSSSR